MTLLKISRTSIATVLDSLLSLLEELARPYKTIAAHPPHDLLSELYVLALTADCCAAHWDSIKTARNGAGDTQESIPLPEPLDDALISRVFEVLKLLLEPIPDGYILPSWTILDDAVSRTTPDTGLRESGLASALFVASPDARITSEQVEAAAADFQSRAKVIVEFITASSWPYSFDYFRNMVYSVRTTVVSLPATAQPVVMSDEERAILVFLRLVSFFWLDGQKLGLIIQEICSSFLHFRKSFQNAVAVITPLLITRWLDRYPDEFVQLHTMHKRLDGGADTLFDMSQTIVDNGRRRAILYPLQTTLLFLLPDVFEVASNLREAKSSSMAKKVAFLDSLRKALRNRNEQAGYCLVSLLRAARHFHAESDAALVSYAMDVQDEVRDAVFRRFPAGTEGTLFDQDMMTAAFVSLAHLNLDSCVDSLVDGCLSMSSPPTFKLAVVQGCCYFASLPDPENRQLLFVAAAPFMRSQLRVCSSASACVTRTNCPRLCSPRLPVPPRTSAKVLTAVRHLSAWCATC